jgi:class I fructose-bisphosphate aldolase
VDQGVEHSAGASFDINPDYFDPENLFKLAIESGVSGFASTFGVLSSLARKYAHKIPLILKINHNELLTYPEKHSQVLFASIEEAWNMGCVAVGATIYFGSEESHAQIHQITHCFEKAHERGLATILWCYLRNKAFKTPQANFHEAADLTGQANYLGATVGADLVKQKLPTCNGGFKTLQYGQYTDKMYRDLCTDHPIDLVRYQVIHGLMGRIGLINSGGPSDKNDLKEVIRAAVINKRGGGIGLISGRKAFKKSFREGIELLHAIQDVYLCKEVTIA